MKRKRELTGLQYARDNDEGDSVGGTGVVALRMVDGDRDGSDDGGTAWIHVIGCEGVENGITPILELNEGIKLDMFRDGIHPNEKGQRFEAGLMKKYIGI